MLSQAAVAWSRISDVTPGSSEAAIADSGRVVDASVAPIISRLLIRDPRSTHLLRNDAKPAIMSFRIIVFSFQVAGP